MVTFSMPGFQGNGIFEVEYLKTLTFSMTFTDPYGQSYYSTLIGNHTQHIVWYHVW